jgi:hypothetical protein
MYLEKPPQDQTERWSGRPFRSFSVGIIGTQDVVSTQSDKQRFLENLWTAQALFRSKEGRSVILCSSDKEVEARNGRVSLARTYFNIYRRTAYLSEPVKVGRHILLLSTDPECDISQKSSSISMLTGQPTYYHLELAGLHTL